MVSALKPSQRLERVSDLLARLISEGAAHFFADACELAARKPPLRTTTHLIGHLIREVESALRQVLRNTPAVQALLNATKTQKQKDKEKHVAEVSAILAVLGLDKDDTAALWTSFVGDRGWHEVAHRQNLRWPRRPDAAFHARLNDFIDVLAVVLDAAEARYTQVTTALDSVLRKPLPDATDVDLLVIHIAPGVTALAHIFEALGPGWLVPLRERGAFLDPPDVERHEGGAYSFPAWPQAAYLLRIAGDVPEEVASTIEQVPTTDNEIIHHALLRAACSMSPAEAARVTVHEARWLGEHSWNLDFAGVIHKLVPHLLEGDEVDAAEALLRAGFSLVAQSDSDLGREARMDDWTYETSVPYALDPFVRKSPQRAKALLFELLEGSKDALVRSAIDDSRQNSREPVDALLNALRDLVESECVDEVSVREAVRDLEARSAPIYSRLALHLLRKRGGLAPDLVAERASDVAHLESVDLFHELSSMVGDRFADLDVSQQQQIVRAIRDTYSQERVGHLRGADTDAARTARYIRHGRRRWFAVLGSSRPADVEAEYRLLCEGIGEPQHPTFLSWVGRPQTGLQSPMQSKELARLTDDALLVHLRDWTPSSNDPFEPSRRGLMRELKKATIEAPERFSRLARDVRNLHSLYAIGILYGVHEAALPYLRGSADESNVPRPVFDADSVIDLAEFAACQSGDHNEDPDEDDAQDWASTRSAAVDAVIDMACLHGPELRRRALVILMRMADDADPTNERIAVRGDDDDVSLSMNCVRGRVLFALFDLATEEPSLAEEIVSFLVTRADVQVEPSRAVRSVLAQRFTKLCALDRAKAEELALTFFTSGPDADVMWRIFLEWNDPTRDVFEVGRGAYEAAVRDIGASSEKTAVMLGSHLVWFAVWGVIPVVEWNSLLRAFVEKAPTASRREPLEAVGRAIAKGEESPAADVVTRLRDLWEWWEGSPRPDALDLTAFGWWFGSPLFTESWSLQTLGRVLALTEGRIERDYAVAKQLQTLASKHPNEVIHCLALFVNGGTPYRVPRSRNAIRETLRQLVTTTEADGARAIAARLVARGHLEFRELGSPDTETAESTG